jgi:hypothetical protein
MVSLAIFNLTMIHLSIINYFIIFWAIFNLIMVSLAIRNLGIKNSLTIVNFNSSWFSPNKFSHDN